MRVARKATAKRRVLARRHLLFAKPRRAPKWWPRDAKGKAQFVGVLMGGDGWALGTGSAMTAAEVKRAQQTFSYGDYGACTFKVEKTGQGK